LGPAADRHTGGYGVVTKAWSIAIPGQCAGGQRVRRCARRMLRAGVVSSRSFEQQRREAPQIAQSKDDNPMATYYLDFGDSRCRAALENAKLEKEFAFSFDRKRTDLRRASERPAN
jgi:hypothetical protein